MEKQLANPRNSSRIPHYSFKQKITHLHQSVRDISFVSLEVVFDFRLPFCGFHIQDAPVGILGGLGWVEGATAFRASGKCLIELGAGKGVSPQNTSGMKLS